MRVIRVFPAIGAGHRGQNPGDLLAEGFGGLAHAARLRAGAPDTLFRCSVAVNG